MEKSSPIERVLAAAARVGLGKRGRESLLAVGSLVAVAVVALAVSSRQDQVDGGTIRAETSLPSPSVALVVPVADEQPPAPPDTAVALRSKSGPEAQFDPPPTTTTTRPPPPPRPKSTAAPTSATTTTSEPPVITTGTLILPPAPSEPNPPSSAPPVTGPVETTVPQTTTTWFELPPFLTWLTRPPQTTAPPPDTAPTETVPPAVEG
jgi:hypothetical protein